MLTARAGRSQPRLPQLPLHPLLAAAYPVVFLFATNAADQLTLDPLWLPLALAVGGAAVVMLLMRIATRDWHLAALATTVLVAGFFGYGHAWTAVGARLDSQWPLIAAWAVLVVIGLFAAWRFRRFARSATPVLNLVTAVLLLVNGAGLTRPLVGLGASQPGSEPSTVALDPGGSELPDVYNIVLDRYAGSTALREVYDFDNEPFLEALEDRGFRVARHAHANYVKTAPSLVSSLNMVFLDGDSLKAEQLSGADPEPIHRRFRERHAVPAAFKALGYQYVHVANWWEPTATNVDADRVFRYAGQDEFSSALVQTTLLRALDAPETASTEPSNWRVLHDNTRYALDTLDEIPAIPGPKFVFAHLVIPHEPFVFDVDGSFVDRPQVAERGHVDSYRRQLQYANSRMIALIDRILAESPDAIILLQADEGPFPKRYRADGWNFPWREATDAELEEKFGILFAMRVPGGDVDDAGFHDSITPVNAWRVIFNARFGTDLPLLEDRVWAHENLYHYFDFVEITDRLGP
jgi:hypothetical protein